MEGVFAKKVEVDRQKSKKSPEGRNRKEAFLGLPCGRQKPGF